MVFHHYVEANDWMALGYASATDPGFVALRNSSTGGAANIFLLELATGTVRRITTMQPGQYALYPHFRSDGWIYFIVRDRNRNREWMVAADAALALE
jgi:Tol biopolymer transport system component